MIYTVSVDAIRGAAIWLENEKEEEKLLFPIAHPHADFLLTWISIIAIKFTFYSLFASDVLV